MCRCTTPHLCHPDLLILAYYININIPFLLHHPISVLSLSALHLYVAHLCSSQPAPHVPVNPPETRYDIAYYKRNQIKKSPPENPSSPLETELWRQEPPPPNSIFHPRHIPQFDWRRDEASLKWIRRRFWECGMMPMGLRHQRPPFHAAKERRGSDEDVELVRDPRIPRWGPEHA